MDGQFECIYCLRGFNLIGQMVEHRGKCPKFDPSKTIHPTPKPATTEPPEWKGEVERSIIVAGKSVPIAADGTFTGADGEVWQVLPPEPSPLDRALEDFVARRKAKREKWGDKVECPGCGLMVSDLAKHTADRHCRKRGNFTFRDPRAEPLSRAMQAPVTFTARMGGR